MQIFDLEKARGSLGRGLARQAMDLAARDDADTARILNELHALVPNTRNRARYAARLGKRRGVVCTEAGREGVVAVLRTVLDVTVREEGVDAFVEPRIGWMWVKAVSGRGRIGFDLSCIHVSLHAMQRRVERSDIDLGNFLTGMDACMLRALSWLGRKGPLRDRGDEYIPARNGVWAGRTERMPHDPAWGPAFASAQNPFPLFAVRTFLNEEQMRPLVWLNWSEKRSDGEAA